MSPQESPYTILVVDDDLEILKLCTLILTRYGFNVLQALGSTEAMQICSTHVGDIHLVLVDLMLDPPVFQLRTEKQPYLRVHGHTLFNGLRKTRKEPSLLNSCRRIPWNVVVPDIDHILAHHDCSYPKIEPNDTREKRSAKSITTFTEFELEMIPEA